MADVNWGERDEKGEWKPDNSPVNSPLFFKPFNLKKNITVLLCASGIFLSQ